MAVASVAIYWLFSKIDHIACCLTFMFKIFRLYKQNKKNQQKNVTSYFNDVNDDDDDYSLAIARDIWSKQKK